MLFPQAEEILCARISLGDRIQAGATRGGRPRPCSLVSQKVIHGNRGGIADLSDLEGVDFDIINKDLLDYYHDCEG